MPIQPTLATRRGTSCGPGPRPRGRLVVLAVLAVLLVVAPFHGARAQARPEIPAFLELDGHRLFEVTASKDYSARQRVERANRLLQDVVASTQPGKIGVRELNNLPVITLDDEVILTVTRRDTPEGMAIERQADLWRRTIAAAIARGRAQRQPAYVARMIPVSLGILGLAFLLQRLLRLVWLRLLPSAFTQPLASESGTIRPLRGMDWLLHGVLVVLQFGLWVAAFGVFPASFPPPGC